VPSETGSFPRVVEIAKDYQRLQLMTKEPVYVDPDLAALCRGATQREVEAARIRSGPHAHTAISIYMNDLAANAFVLLPATYPVGSIILKEKKALGYQSDGQQHTMTKTHDGVGGMIKRQPGYDPEHGDWEYFYFEDVGQIESGRISSCVHCHGAAANKDYVFGGWRRKDR